MCIRDSTLLAVKQNNRRVFLFVIFGRTTVDLFSCSPTQHFFCLGRSRTTIHLPLHAWGPNLSNMSRIPCAAVTRCCLLFSVRSWCTHTEHNFRIFKSSVRMPRTVSSEIPNSSLRNLQEYLGLSFSSCVSFLQFSLSQMQKICHLLCCIPSLR